MEGVKGEKWWVQIKMAHIQHSNFGEKVHVCVHAVHRCTCMCTHTHGLFKEL